MGPQDLYEPQKQAKDIKVRAVHEPLFCSGKELTAGAWELIRQSREIYAGRGMIQDSYKQYNSQLAEELRMNHHFSNFTVEKPTGEKRKMAELSLQDFDDYENVERKEEPKPIQQPGSNSIMEDMFTSLNKLYEE